VQNAFEKWFLWRPTKQLTILENLNGIIKPVL
jgi:hypothetical protein